MRCFRALREQSTGFADKPKLPKKPSKDKDTIIDTSASHSQQQQQQPSHAGKKKQGQDTQVMRDMEQRLSEIVAAL